jgi:hypothetical protein
MWTNRNKIVSWIIVTSLLLVGWANAANIGTGTVTGSGGMAQPIVWNDTFPGTATGVINGIAIKAKIQPTLNMEISGTGLIDLGNLTSASYNTGTVSIEIGTNATAGAVVTAKSTNGGLKSGTGDFINNLVVDGAADSYLFTSTIGAATDSSFTGTINQTFMNSTEVNSTVTAYQIYGSSRPQQKSGSIDDITFSVSAKPNAQSPAGNYADVIVVTVTGTF